MSDITSKQNKVWELVNEQFNSVIYSRKWNEEVNLNQYQNVLREFYHMKKQEEYVEKIFIIEWMVKFRCVQ